MEVVDLGGALGGVVVEGLESLGLGLVVEDF